MKKSRKKALIQVIYIGITILVIILIGAFSTDLEDIGSAIQSIHPMWLAGAFLCTFVYWLTETWLLQNTSSYIGEKRLSFKKYFKISIIGLYYSALTPSSTGGQPMQIVYMKRENIPVGTSTGILVIKYVVYALSVIALYIAATIISGGTFMQDYPAIYWLSILGIVLFSLSIGLFALTLANEKVVRKAGHGLIGFLNKIKLVKKKEKVLDSFDGVIDDYNETSRYLRGNKRSMIGSFFISVLNIGMLYAITYFIYRAFSLSDHSFLTIMVMQALLYTAVSYFPIPGAAGASEGGFFVVFNLFFPQSLIFTAMLLWRFLTFYLILVVGCLVVIVDEFVSIRRTLAKESKE